MIIKLNRQCIAYQKFNKTWSVQDIVSGFFQDLEQSEADYRVIRKYRRDLTDVLPIELIRNLVESICKGDFKSSQK